MSPADACLVINVGSRHRCVAQTHVDHQGTRLRGVDHQESRLPTVLVLPGQTGRRSAPGASAGTTGFFGATGETAT